MRQNAKVYETGNLRHTGEPITDKAPIGKVRFWLIAD
jgi:hypothetical protein